MPVFGCFVVFVVSDLLWFTGDFCAVGCGVDILRGLAVLVCCGLGFVIFGILGGFAVFWVFSVFSLYFGFTVILDVFYCICVYFIVVLKFIVFYWFWWILLYLLLFWVFYIFYCLIDVLLRFVGVWWLAVRGGICLKFVVLCFIVILLNFGLFSDFGKLCWGRFRFSGLWVVLYGCCALWASCFGVFWCILVYSWFVLIKGGL